MNIIEIDDRHRPWVDQYIAEEWGGPMIASRGKLYDSRGLGGFAAVEGDRPLGAVLLRPEGRECEVAVLFSLAQNRGVGTALMNRAADFARQQGSTRLWLITTNDNTHAIRFYQRYGMALKAVHIGAMAEARRLKPGIPPTGIDDIPLEHEFEFELML